MARKDLHNHSEYWTDKGVPGISFLKADFRNLQYAPHVHDELVIAITVRGAGKSVTKHGADTSTPGQLLVYNPHEPHEGGAVEGYGWQYRAFYISSAAIDQLSSNLSPAKVQATYFMNNCIEDRRLSSAMHHAHAILEVSRDPVQADPGRERDSAGQGRHGLHPGKLRVRNLHGRPCGRSTAERVPLHARIP